MWSAATANEGPKYQQIAADLTARIRRGEYPAGEVMSTLAQLSAEYEVSDITVRQAVRLLSEQGLVRSVPGKGIFPMAEVQGERDLTESRVGILLPGHASWYALFPALFDEMHALGHDILMKPLPTRALSTAPREQARCELEALRTSCGGGLILYGDRFLAETFLSVRRPDEAVVLLENSDGVPTSLPMVTTDNFGGMFTLTRHLLGLGHRRIAFVDWLLIQQPDDDRFRPGAQREQRLAGYRAALRAASEKPCMPRDLLEALVGRRELGRLRELCRRPGMPTALIGLNDAVAGDVHERLTAAGIAVPEELSLAGYDNTSQLHGGNWLTSLDENGVEIARQLVRQLHAERHRLQTGREGPGPWVFVPPTLHARASIAPPRDDG